MGSAPHLRAPRKECPAKRGLHRIRVQGSSRSATQHAPPGKGQIRQPPPVSGPFEGAGRGKAGPSLTCRERAPAREGRGGARAITPRPRSRAGDAPGGSRLAPGAWRKEGGRGARRARGELAGSDGRRRERRLASRGPGGDGIWGGAARSPPAARAPASRAVAAAAAAAAAAAPPRRLLHLCGGSSGSAHRRHQQQHSETSLSSCDPTQS